jgi:hypothetical protein
MRNAECGMQEDQPCFEFTCEIATRQLSSIRNPQSAIRNRKLPVAQTDYDPDRVTEVVQPLTPGSGAQVIELGDANG